MFKSIDFIIYLPVCNGHNAIFTCANRLTEYCRLITCFVGKEALSAS